MSDCIKNCRLCNKMILSQSIAFTGGNLVVDLPANSYGNCQKYCIVFAQTIPDTTPIYASQVRSRRLYSTRVNTAVNTGVFKYIGKCCLPSNATTVANSIPVETTPTPTTR